MAQRAHFAGVIVGANLVLVAQAGATEAPAWVNSEFVEMRTACLPGVDKIKFREKPKDVDFAPPKLLTELRLPDSFSYQSFANSNMTRIFGYVYSEAEKANVTNFVPDNQRYLEIDFDRDDDQITSAGLGTVVYDKDCSGALDLATEGRANAEFAPATLAAAARSALQRKFSARLSLYKGQFENPLIKQWRGQATEANTSELMQVYAALTLWDWYSRNGIPAGKSWLLDAVSGISLYRFVQDSSSAESTASAKAALAIPFLSAKFEGGGALRGGSLFRLERFHFARYEVSGGIGSYTQFLPLPPIATVQNVISGVGGRLTNLRLAQNQDDVARPGSQKSFLLDVDGLPAPYCSRLMTVAGKSSSALEIDEPTRIEQDGAIPVCRFPLRYRVPASNGENLDFVLKPVTYTLPTGVAAFEIPVKRTLARSETPTIVNITQEPQPPQIVSAVAAGVTQLTWQVPGLLLDEGMIADAASVDRTKFGPQACPADAERLGDFQLGHSIGPRINAQQRPVTFTVTANYRGLKPDWQSRAQVCRIGGRITLNGGGVSVERLLPGFEIFVPDDRDTSPPTE